MRESVQIFLAFVFMVGVFVLTRYIIGWKFRRVSVAIIRELEERGARDPLSAAELPYSKPNLLRLGLRDYHSKALEYMVAEGIVARTQAGKFYLIVAPPGSHGPEMPHTNALSKE